MGFFDPNAGGGNNGGGGTPFTDITLKDKVQITDADGNILTSLPLGDNGKASYSRVLTADNIGQNGIGAKFTGNGRFAGGSVDSFNTHVADANGNNATKGIFQGVTQIVAGAGIYISAPNGQGVVTISTTPIDPNPITENLSDVQWSKKVFYAPADSQYPGEFVAVGQNGVTARSRDGHNWVKLPYPTIKPETYDGVYATWGSELPSGLTYTAYYFNTSTQRTHIAVGYPGNANNDGFYDDYAMVDQNNQPLLPIFTGYNFSTQSTVEFIYIGETHIGHDQFTVINTSTASMWIEEVVNTVSFFQVSASNTSTSDTFKAVATCYNIDTYGNAIAGGGVYASDRNGTTTSTWTKVYNDTIDNIHATSYGNGIFVAGGTNNSIYRSTDGVSWTKSTGAIPGATWWYGAFGNGKHVMVGYAIVNGREVGVLQYSTDGGQTWTRGSPGTTNRLYGISYSPELNVFVACGRNGTLVSVDG